MRWANCSKDPSSPPRQKDVWEARWTVCQNRELLLILLLCIILSSWLVVKVTLSIFKLRFKCASIYCDFDWRNMIFLLPQTYFTQSILCFVFFCFFFANKSTVALLVTGKIYVPQSKSIKTKNFFCLAEDERVIATDITFDLCHTWNAQFLCDCSVDGTALFLGLCFRVSCEQLSLLWCGCYATQMLM